jgi:hypothetical protein
LCLALAACSTQQQNQPTLTGASPGVQHFEACSMVGIMACRTMSMLSRDDAVERQSTCTAYRTASGSRVETCGSVGAPAPPTLKAKDPVAKSAASRSGRNVLTWSDNSRNETNFVIERCDQVTFTKKDNKTASCAGVWKSIGTVAANVTEYIDDTAIVDQTYLYRIKAMNQSGSSGYTNEAVIKTPPR